MPKKSKMLKVTDADFDSVVLKSDIPVVVYFWAPWCGSCRSATLALERLVAECKGKIKVCSVNVDECDEEGGVNVRTASWFGVADLPTILLFEGGRELTRGRQEGSCDLTKLHRILGF